MSQARFDIDEIAPEAIPGVRVMPVLHERVDLAALARCVLDQLQPAAIAIELPTTLRDAAERAVRRLPEISVVISEEPGNEALVWVVTPGDPLVEAMRWAIENERPFTLVDPDIRYRPRHADPVPDPHVLWTLGPDRYLDLLRSVADRASPCDADTLREQGLAYNIQRAQDAIGGPILCLVGAMHATRVAQHLRRPLAQPLARQHRPNVLVRHLHPESLTAVLRDLPLAHAVFESIRDRSLPPPAELEHAVSQRVELLTAGLRLITGDTTDQEAQRGRNLVRYAVHHGTRTGPTGAPVPDRGAIGHVIWRVAAASYREQTREETGSWQRRLFFDFARRYARLQGLLIPGLYEWVVAGRGVGDDNLAWEVFDTARTYPWQQEESELATARVDGDMLDLGTRTVRFRRRFFRVKAKPVAIPVRRRPSPNDPGDWLRAFDGDSICSYPPEDLVVEDYGRFLQRRAMSALSAERSRSEPFVTSLLDGIDIRETLSRWHEGRVWVRELGRAPGAAGSVVVIFDDDPDGASFPYLMTWLGEHDQESDMALYATDPTQQIVGPGIMRATYGGFMMTYPPGRLFDVWHDPDYRQARSKPEVLLMAAVDYSREKLVVQVAATPPSARIHHYAGVQGKRVMHIPIGSLSPVTVRKVRVVHILAGRDKRDIAKDYVW